MMATENSIKRVMEVREPDKKASTALWRDLIDVPKEYEIAIETALGGSIQNIVTDSEPDREGTDRTSEKERFGRATFLPLSAISAGNGFNTPGALKEPGAIGIAADLVHVRPEYQTLARYPSRPRPSWWITLTTPSPLRENIPPTPSVS